MTWISWTALAVIGALTGLLVRFLYSEDSGGLPCCHCGRCLETGHCVMRKKREAKKGENPPETP